MSKTVLRSFVSTKLGTILSQEMDYSQDSVHLMDDETELLKVDSSGYVFTADDKRIAKFRLYDSSTPSFLWEINILSDELKSKLGYETKQYPDCKGMESLIKSEFEFFKEYAEKVL